MKIQARSQTALYAVLLFLCGLGYRATFLSQGFHGTDEPWLRALALRVAHGQVVYRDFYYAIPPLTVYKEAAIAAFLGSGYTYIASRWVFALEVSVATVIAFMIVRRFTSPTVAFLSTLPAIFFTTVLYVYSNFNFDAQLLFLVALLIVVWAGERERWFLMAIAGIFCGLAFLAKPTYLAMGVGICGLGLLRPLMAGPRRWPLFAAGFVAVLGTAFFVIWMAGLWPQFQHQAFGLLLQARPVSKRQLIYQDWPTYLLLPGYAAMPALAAGIALVVARWSERSAALLTLLFGVVVGWLIVVALPTSTAGVPTKAQLDVLVGGLALVLAINLVGAAVTVAARLPGIASRPWAERVRAELFPPAVPVVAAVLEYLHGLDLSSMRFAYVGSFLGIPVALTLLYQGWQLWTGKVAPRPRLLTIAAPAIAGLFLVVGGAVVTRGSPYLDGPRDQMTATILAPALSGITTVPAKAAHVNALVAEIDRDTRPGDPIFVFPDGQAYYELTGRTNPTRIDYYDPLAMTPAMSLEAVSDLKRNPPQVVVVQRFNEWDISQQYPADFDAEPVWKPIHDFIIETYDLVGTVDDADVYRLK